MNSHNERIDFFIQQIRELHFVRNYSAEEITELYLESYPESHFGRNLEKARKEMLDYTKRVIYQHD